MEIFKNEKNSFNYFHFPYNIVQLLRAIKPARI